MCHIPRTGRIKHRDNHLKVSSTQEHCRQDDVSRNNADGIHSKMIPIYELAKSIMDLKHGMF